MFNYPTYSLNSVAPEIKDLQRVLNETLQLDLLADGHLGKITQANLKLYQSKNKIVENDKFGACYGPETQKLVIPYAHERFLQQDHVIQIANLMKLEIPIVKAVVEVESKQFGFLNDGFPVILFERHLFYRFMEKKFGVAKADQLFKLNPNICNNSPGGYSGGSREKDRFYAALKINEEAAIYSTSFGLFQILGMNFKNAGSKDIYSFFERMKESELEQLLAFMHFVMNDKNMYSALQRKDWTTFARRYNGPGYATAHSVPYDIRLANAYQKHLKK